MINNNNVTYYNNVPRVYIARASVFIITLQYNVYDCSLGAPLNGESLYGR